MKLVNPARLLLLLSLAVLVLRAAPPLSWTADNGNGSFTNPLFYDEFSDPDLIRVGDDFYLAGTTMHAMPGVVVLHSRDLVNWTFLSYAASRLDLGPGFRLEEGRDIYGQGIWAPCIRHHQGTFYIFSNINGHGLQVFSSRDPRGPWTHRSLESGIHDLSVLFDDDGKVYAVYGYDQVSLIEMKPDLSGFIEGSDRVIIPRGNAMGEGHHFYKINGKYYIISANYAPVGRMQCARADRPDGPYETVVISAGETFGTERGDMVRNVGLGRPLPEPGFSFEIDRGGGNSLGAMPLHQGGIVDLPNGDWWGYSMMDFRSVGRTTALSPVTWKNGWPYFGVPGNLGRTPRTWLKPAVGEDSAPTAPYVRSDDFTGPELLPVWQWNHLPVDARWSLAERPGHLRLHALPAPHFIRARNTLTQRVIGPVSTATAVLDASGLREGDTAGLGLLNLPFALLGVERRGDRYWVREYDQRTNNFEEAELPGPVVHLRATGDFDADRARFSYSSDGLRFVEIGGEVQLPYQLKTFQGTRFALYAFRSAPGEGGHADFDRFMVEEPLASRAANLPLGKLVRLANLADGSLCWANPHGMLHSVGPDSAEAAGKRVLFRIHDRGHGRVALEAADGSGFVTVVGEGLSSDVRLKPVESLGSLFQWQDMLRGQCMLLSLVNHRHIGKAPGSGEPYGAESPGARPDRRDGAVFRWEISEEK